MAAWMIIEEPLTFDSRLRVKDIDDLPYILLPFKNITGFISSYRSDHRMPYYTTEKLYCIELVRAISINEVTGAVISVPSPFIFEFTEKDIRKYIDIINE